MVLIFNASGYPSTESKAAAFKLWQRGLTYTSARMYDTRWVQL